MPFEGPMLLMIVLELRATGSLSTRWFQGLFAGNALHPPTRGAPPPAALAAAATVTAAITGMARSFRIVRRLGTSVSRCAADQRMVHRLLIALVALGIAVPGASAAPYL